MKYKYKVCVYAICKNEEQFVDRWYESVKEADEIYVLDTGSNDNTVTKLLDHGINVKIDNIIPWRFDKARNMALEMVPMDTDICVSVDLDEVFVPGWRLELEKSWKDDTTRAKYIYNWKLENDKPLVTFYYDKIHIRNGYSWVYPVHEILNYDNGNENYVICDKIILNHYPDSNKSRGNYLSLLELSVKENPLNDRNMHYLGREYMYHSRWNECIETLIKHLQLKNATWKDERAASMRYIARSYKNMGRNDEANLWYLKAIDEAPDLRDGYVEYAMLKYSLGEYYDTIKYLIMALSIKKRKMTYVNEIFSWDYTIDNLLACSYYYLGLNDEALFYIDKALSFDSNNKMLIDNKNIIKNTE